MPYQPDAVYNERLAAGVLLINSCFTRRSCSLLPPFSVRVLPATAPALGRFFFALVPFCRASLPTDFLLFEAGSAFTRGELPVDLCTVVESGGSGGGRVFWLLSMAR